MNCPAAFEYNLSSHKELFHILILGPGPELAKIGFKCHL